MLAERQDHELLEEAISHHELLGGTADVAVVVKDAHACETTDLNLKGHVLAQIGVGLSLLGGEGTSVVRAHLPDRGEALVSNLIDHCLLINNYKYQTI